LEVPVISVIHKIKKLLRNTNWRSSFIYRHKNSLADFLARYARTPKEHNWLEEMEERYINPSGLNVVKKINFVSFCVGYILLDKITSM
jgi:hypothetical protein